MARARVRVAKLAYEAQLKPDDALKQLIAAGIRVRSTRDSVPKRQVRLARETLGLSSASAREDRRLVSSLAARAGIAVEDAGARLVEAGVLPKRSRKRVPRGLIRDAERALGLADEPPDPPLVEAEPVSFGLQEERVKPARGAEPWPRVGPEEDVEHLSVREIEQIHWALVEDFAKSRDPIDPPGVRDQNLLESAAFRPMTALGEQSKYPTISMAAASLLHAIVHDHPFHNGNKRTALVSMLVLLDKNGWVLNANEPELFDFLIKLGGHQLRKKRGGEPITTPDGEMIRAARWIQARSRRIERREFPLRFAELRRILTRCGCHFEHAPKGVRNRVTIRKGDLSYRVNYRDEGEEMSPNSVHEIRKALQLDEQHGCDSKVFYDGVVRIPEFINKYRKLLDRLADY